MDTYEAYIQDADNIQNNEVEEHNQGNDEELSESELIDYGYKGEDDEKGEDEGEESEEDDDTGDEDADGTVKDLTTLGYAEY